MVDPTWKKVKDKVTAKRGNKRDTGDKTHKLLKGNEPTVQRLSCYARQYFSGLGYSRWRARSFLQDLGADTGYEDNLREIRYW